MAVAGLADALPVGEALFGKGLVLRARAAVDKRIYGNAAARREFAENLHVLRLEELHEIVVDHVYHIFMEVAVVAEAEEVELERFRLDEPLRRYVAYRKRREVGLACLRAEGRELGRGERHPVVAVGVAVVEGVQYSRIVVLRTCDGLS